MSIRRPLLAAIAAAFFCAPALAAETPEARIQNLYDAYIRAENDTVNGPDQLDPALYSARRRAQIARLQATCKDKDWCLPDADFLIDGQDFKITRLSVRRIGGTATRPTVEAKFRNFNTPVTIRFELVKEEGRGWVIDDFRQPKTGARLGDQLKPIQQRH